MAAVESVDVEHGLGFALDPAPPRWRPVDVDTYDTEEPPHFDGWGTLLAAIEDRRPDWQIDAACRYAEDVTFFPDRGEPAAPGKALCASCDAVDACRDYAQAEGIRHGIWGGQTWTRVPKGAAA